MIPTLWALVLASQGRPSGLLVVLFMAGSFIMRSAGVIINDLADRSFDRQVTRTQSRPLASGVLRPWHAILFLGILLAIAVSLLLFLNPLAIRLGPGALALAAIYPFTKRFFRVPQLFLGLAFGWGAVMAWAAVRNQLDPGRPSYRSELIGDSLRFSCMDRRGHHRDGHAGTLGNSGLAGKSQSGVLWGIGWRRGVLEPASLSPAR